MVKKLARYVLKAASKRFKKPEAAADLIENEIADKITIKSKTKTEQFDDTYRTTKGNKLLR